MVFTGRFPYAAQIQASVGVGHEARAAVVTALNDMQGDAGKR
jgi:hypothetical protein